MALRFAWDVTKALANVRRHGITFAEAATAFGDPLSITIPDPAHSVDEEHFILIGRTVQHNVVVVAHVERGDTIRLISARPASRRERIDYEEGQ